MAEEFSGIMLRVRLPLRLEVEKAAKQNRRSISAEVAHRLDRSFTSQRRRKRTRKAATVAVAAAPEVRT